MSDNPLIAHGTLAKQPTQPADDAAPLQTAAFTQTQGTPSQLQLETTTEVSAQQQLGASPGSILQTDDSMAGTQEKACPGRPSPKSTFRSDAGMANLSPEGPVETLPSSQQAVAEGLILTPVEIPSDFHIPHSALFNGGSERGQNEKAGHGLILAEIVSVYGNEDSNEENGLFVRQPGEVKVVNNTIDLTQETEAESDARALRVSQLPTDTEPPGTEDFELIIKEEEEEDFVSQETDSDYMDESDDGRPKKNRGTKKAKRAANINIPDDVEDAQDMLDMLSAEKHMLSRHNANNTLKRGQAERLKEVGKIITALAKRIQELTATQAEAQSSAAQPNGQDISLHSYETAPEGQSMAIAASFSLITRKRKALAQTTGRVSKKQSCALVAPARERNKGNAAKESTQLILNLLQNQDVFAAGQAMAELPVLEGFDATTWKDQEKHFRHLVANGHSADKKKIRGDRIMLARARTALTRKYRISGDKYVIAGMKTPLYAYQFVATGWMVGKELSTEVPQGGILADSMGLGKTVTTLACIVSNPPTEEDQNNGLRITLVIVPANAVGQWITEIYKHGNGISAFHYKKSDIIHEAAREYSSVW